MLFPSALNVWIAGKVLVHIYCTVAFRDSWSFLMTGVASGCSVEKQSVAAAAAGDERRR